MLIFPVACISCGRVFLHFVRASGDLVLPSSLGSGPDCGGSAGAIPSVIGPFVSDDGLIRLAV